MIIVLYRANLSLNVACFDDDLPPPLPPKMVDFDEEMELGFENEIEETPLPLPPPYKETSLKQTLVSTSMHTDCPITVIILY